MGASSNANGKGFCTFVCTELRESGRLQATRRDSESPTSEKKTPLRHHAESKSWLVGDGQVQGFVRACGTPRSAFACSDNPVS